MHRSRAGARGAAETTTGANDLRGYALPVDRLLAAMRKDGRLP